MIQDREIIHNVDFRSFDVFFFLFLYRDLVRSNNQRDNDSSGDDEREGQIRVGKEYQINPPEFIPLESKYIINLVHTLSLFCFPKKL